MASLGDRGGGGAVIQYHQMGPPIRDFITWVCCGGVLTLLPVSLVSRNPIWWTLMNFWTFWKKSHCLKWIVFGTMIDEITLLPNNE